MLSFIIGLMMIIFLNLLNIKRFTNYIIIQLATFSQTSGLP